MELVRNSSAIHRQCYTVPPESVLGDCMEQPGAGERPTNFNLQVPPELEGGVYANFLGVWHTGYEFTLDFAVIQPADVPENLACLVAWSRG